MPTATYFLAGRAFADPGIDLPVEGRFGLPPRSIAFYDDQTGDVWFRRIVPGSKWMFYCLPLHQQWGDRPPGSLWLDWMPELHDSLPLPLLLREVELHCELALKRMNNGN